MPDTINPTEAKLDKLDKALERGLISKEAYDMEIAVIASTTTVNTVEVEPITIGFKIKESDGSTILHMDEYSTSAVEGGYDALRSANLARANDDKEAENKALSIVAACADRAKEAGKALVNKAADKATECMRPGGKASDRAAMRVMLKGALKAYRVSAKRK